MLCDFLISGFLTVNYDFKDLNEIVGETDAKQALYLEALEHLEKDSIPYQSIRTEFVGCANDTEY